MTAAHAPACRLAWAMGIASAQAHQRTTVYTMQAMKLTVPRSKQCWTGFGHSMLSTRADRLSLGGGRDEGDGIRVEARALSRVSTPLPDPQIPGALAGGSPGQQRSVPCRAVAQRRRWGGWDEGEGSMGEARALSRVSTPLPDPRIPGALAGGSPGQQRNAHGAGLLRADRRSRPRPMPWKGDREGDRDGLAGSLHAAGLWTRQPVAWQGGA